VIKKLQGLNPFDTDKQLIRLDKQTQNTNLIIWTIRFMKHINQSQKSGTEPQIDKGIRIPVHQRKRNSYITLERIFKESRYKKGFLQSSIYLDRGFCSMIQGPIIHLSDQTR
jgi:hypothetical protein